MTQGSFGRLRRVPLAAWILGGMVVIAAVVPAIILNAHTSSSGPATATAVPAVEPSEKSAGCDMLKAKAPPLLTQFETDAGLSDYTQIATDAKLVESLLTEAANVSSGDTSRDMRALASEFFQVAGQAQATEDDIKQTNDDAISDPLLVPADQAMVGGDDQLLTSEEVQVASDAAIVNQDCGADVFVLDIS